MKNKICLFLLLLTFSSASLLAQYDPFENVNGAAKRASGIYFETQANIRVSKTAPTQLYEESSSRYLSKKKNNGFVLSQEIEPSSKMRSTGAGKSLFGASSGNAYMNNLSGFSSNHHRSSLDDIGLQAGPPGGGPGSGSGGETGGGGEFVGAPVGDSLIFLLLLALSYCFYKRGIGSIYKSN